ncbi:hypothetical protein AGLY_016149 [Aphis glycines]|uniref:Uncharacterized protein n=1 Tax=Aphis glycines TaxID=307491 RepID=A0A6G0T116_APHGL|nr:hypothetical protein AGLY_016149 [Aphis glycines]
MLVQFQFYFYTFLNNSIATSLYFIINFIHTSDWSIFTTMIYLLRYKNWSSFHNSSLGLLKFWFAVSPASLNIFTSESYSTKHLTTSRHPDIAAQCNATLFSSSDILVFGLYQPSSLEISFCYQLGLDQHQLLVIYIQSLGFLVYTQYAMPFGYDYLKLIKPFLYYLIHKLHKVLELNTYLIKLQNIVNMYISNNNRKLENININKLLLINNKQIDDCKNVMNQLFKTFG